MNIEHRKLFDIKYNNKTFTLFMADNRRIFFLEKGSDGKYDYPLFEDFKALDAIYNINNPFIYYSNKGVFFKERVRITSGVLAFVLTVGTITGAYGRMHEIIFNEDTNEVKIVYNNDFYIGKTFADTSYLDEVLGYKSVSKEQIFEAIDNNANLSEEYKVLARNLVNRYLEEVPNADLRIFYENIKTLKIVELDASESEAVLGENVAGNYNSLDNQINLKNDATAPVIYHELFHTTQSFCYKLGGRKIVYRSDNSDALNEAMNNKITSLIIKPYSYINEGLVLDYLLSFVNFSLEDYNKYGIDELISRIKSKYPEVNVDYIVSFTNAMMQTEITTGNDIVLAENTDFLDELFDIALASIDLNGNVYEPFVNFAKLLENNEDVIDRYLEKYNAYLRDLNYQDIITNGDLEEICNIYANCNRVAAYDGKSYLSSVVENKENTQVYIVRGTNFELVDQVLSRSISNMPVYIKLNYLKYKSLYSTQEFWDKMIAENHLLDDYIYKTLSIYLNGELIAEDYLRAYDVGINKDENGNITYNLVRKDSTDSLNYYTTIDLLTYLTFYPIEDKVELSYVFIDSYLRGIDPTIFEDNLTLSRDMK